MNLINDIITQLSKEISRKFENLVMARLFEMGYNISGPKEAAERLHIIKHEDNPIHELWMDKGKPEEQLIAYFTETIIKQQEVNSYKITSEFKFGPMPKETQS